MPYKDKEQQKEYQRIWLAKRRAHYIAELGGCCCKCGSTDDLELDHKDRNLKVDHRIWSWSHARIKEEISKCQLLCGPCHRNKTKQEWVPLNKGKRYDTVPHGTQTMYKKGCSCPKCKQAHTEAARKYKTYR